ncbi:hypothetical protein BaRGS_00006961 [Batillaria attramentaria]|uniref:Major facilitator superfamily (MFS) profile domain-containing protein n=1 Tax=Batillaria attramentaria TaxID=370345 RepID=A0ABD0LQM6_9CAEN
MEAGECKETDRLLQPSRIPQKIQPVKLCLSYRLLVTFLCMGGMIMCFANQSSMGSAMVCMTLDPPVVFANNTTVIPPSANASLNPYKFYWDKTTQGWVHSSLFVGYYISQLPSGILATRYGGRRVALFGLFFSSAGQLLTPVAASAGVPVLCTVRALAGFASGFIYAPVFGVLANWVPQAESSLLFGLTGTGMELGAVISFGLSALCCQLDVMGGWPLTFYSIGGLGMLMTVGFACLVSDLPSQNKRIGRRERLYIERAVGAAGGHGHKKKTDADAPLTRKIPIKSILTSGPVLAIVVAQIGSDWLYYQLITVQPSFMQEILKLDETTINLLTGLPFLAIIPAIYVAGTLADFLRDRRILSTTATRKLADFLCKIFPGGILVSFGFLQPGQEALYIILYVLACILMAFSYVSWITNPVDLSPAYTGFIASVCETGAMWIAIAVPILIENITKDKTAEEWRTVFYITGGLQLATFIFYLIFGSSELQPWGRPDDMPPITVTCKAADDDDKIAIVAASTRNERRSRSRVRPSSPVYASDSEVGRIRMYRSRSMPRSSVRPSSAAPEINANRDKFDEETEADYGTLEKTM